MGDLSLLTNRLRSGLRSHRVGAIVILAGTSIALALSSATVGPDARAILNRLVIASDVMIAAGLVQLAYVPEPRASEIEAAGYFRVWFRLWIVGLAMTAVLVLEPLATLVASLPPFVGVGLRVLAVVWVFPAGFGYLLFLITELGHAVLVRLGLVDRWERTVYLLDGKGINRWVADRLQRRKG